MTDQSLFGEDPNKPATPAASAAAGANTNNSNPLETLLAGIKNESGVQKYQSVEEALKALYHSQNYIPTLKQESEEAKRQAQEATRMAEEAKAQLKRQEDLERSVQELTQKLANQSTPTGENKLTPEQIAEMVNRTLEGREAASTAKQNAESVKAALEQKFGDKAAEVFNAQAQELGMTPAQLSDWARQAPKAVLKALGVSGPQAQPKSSAPFQSAVNTAGFNPSQETFVKRNDKQLEIGATFYEMQEETRAAKRMVEELHNQGLEIADLTNPREYFKIFGKQ